MCPVPLVLVVDKERNVRQALAAGLEAQQFSVRHCAGLAEARAILNEQPVDLAFVDLQLEDGDGMELLAELPQKWPGCIGVALSNQNRWEVAVEAMRHQVRDILVKPLQPQELAQTAQRLLDGKDKAPPPTQPAPPPKSKKSAQLVKEKISSRPLIGSSKAMRGLNALIERVAPTDSTVLIRGESGTGKELVARALHGLSPRAEKPLIPVNCGAIPEDLLESELFGHVRGSFTGAISDRPGRFLLANHGTIFLDEIGDMSPKLQVKILRVLQEQEMEPVGSTETIRVNTRVLAATNVDLEKAVEAKRFREDLYYRLNVIPIVVPPLRDRLDDLPLLIAHFLKDLNAQTPRPLEGFTPQAMEALRTFNWPGNVRELENLVERMTILAMESMVQLEDLPEKFRHTGKAETPAPPPHIAFMEAGQQLNQQARGLSESSDEEGKKPVSGEVTPSPFLISEGVSSEEKRGFRLSEYAGEDNDKGPGKPSVEDGIDLTALVDDFERSMILEALEKCKGVKSRAAEMLGIKRTTLVEKMKKKNIVYEK